MGPDAGDEGWVDVAAAGDLADGQLRAVEVEGERICLGRAGEAFFAIDDTCPHAGGSLAEGMLQGRFVLCPLHAYAFDPNTGECPDDPRCSVAAYPIRVDGDRVKLRLRAPAKPENPA